MITKKTRLLETYSLILLDMLTVVLSFYLATSIRERLDLSHWGFGEKGYLVCVLVTLASILYGVFLDYNREFFIRGYFVELVAIIKYETALALMFGAIVFLVQAKEFSRIVFVLFVIFDFILTYIFHISFKRVVLRTFKKSGMCDKVMIVSDSGSVEGLLEQIDEAKDWNYDITSIALFNFDKKPEKDLEYNGIPVVAGREDLVDIATLLPLDAVFISVQSTDYKVIRSIIEQFELMGITCHYNVERKELNLEGKTAGNFAGYTVMSFSLNNRDYRRVFIKKIIDLFGAVIGLIFTAIITPFIAICIKLESKGPVFFAQERVGKNGRVFKLYKFRSMYMDAEERKAELMKENEMKGLMFKLEDDPRVTRIGKFLRKTSIDEFPQFYNVLRGDMSLVGTRPPTVGEFEEYSAYYKRRLSVTPGITGLWQVSGRSEINDFDEVVKLDIYYIEHWSLLLDLKILLQTVIVVLFHKGAK